MRFWDSSALVPLLVPEEESARCADFLRGDRGIIVWALTPTEIVSALHRKMREGALTGNMFSEARRRLGTLEAAWTEITHLELVRKKAERILGVHLLRAADGLQLAAALVAFGDAPQSVPFVTLDDNLAEAAGKEGFSILP